ncbi:glycosyltransferase [Acetivibrio straminisolvens JCM 21531]|uniref:Glycosyltransferase n=2 Tax=Acetivibrio straminisolvens TaxID=253314 RepID=W4V9S7_9FIRM|nr:glycosyltransferase [Acetivibrio straminisolvens JCM 21531]
MRMNTVVKNILLTPFNILYRINPSLNLKLLFLIKCHYRLNLQHPVTYNEKLQWIKLYERNPIMPKCADKYTVRQYVESRGCGNILNELIWQGFNPEDIPFDSLPKRCVIKVTHGSTFNIICKDITTLNRAKTISMLKRWLKVKFLPCYGEWFYGIERPRIIVEKYLQNSADDDRLDDYKVYCFNGIPRYISVDSGRNTRKHYKNIYNTKWELQKDYRMAYPCNNIEQPAPKCLEEMLKYAEILSADFYHARVDFYVVDDKPVFGEITFTNSAGFGKVLPYEFEKAMGDYLKLPCDNR